MLRRHFEREETDDGSVNRLDAAVRVVLGLVGLRRREGDVGRKRGLAHRRAPGKDHEVGRLQPAEPLVEIAQPRRDAGKPAVALVGFGRHVDRDLERLVEALEAALVFAALGELVERLFRVEDLRARRVVHRRVIGAVVDVGADIDEFAPHREFVDRAPVFFGVDDRRRRVGEARQILRAADFGQRRVALEEVLQRHRRGEVALRDQLRRRLVNSSVYGIEEMRRLEKARHAVVGLVVDEDRAQERLLRVDIVRLHPVGGVGALAGLCRIGVRCVFHGSLLADGAARFAGESGAPRAYPRLSSPEPVHNPAGFGEAPETIGLCAGLGCGSIQFYRESRAGQGAVAARGQTKENRHDPLHAGHPSSSFPGRKGRGWPGQAGS